MEEFFYIVLLVIWLIVSLYKRNAKVKQQKEAGKQQAQPEATTALPKELDLEDMLEEFFGGGKKKQPEVVLDADEMSSQESYTYESEQSIPVESDRQQTASEPAYQSWESKAQRSYNEEKQSYNEDRQLEIAETYAEPEYKSFYADLADDHASFTEVGKLASIEELIKTHAAKDAMEQARAEMAYGSGEGHDLPEFDLRTAVVFSEILNKKYS
jgi:hypothetical protein